MKTASCRWSSITRELTKEYVKTRAELPAPHNLSASQSEAARSESVGPEAALGYHLSASLIQQAQTLPFNFTNFTNLMTTTSVVPDAALHLGSSSFITDATGTAIQHLEYLLYGELWVNQQSGSFDSRYKFSAKEKDNDTQYSYFGARYVAFPAESGNSDMSVWISVDPLAGKYPSTSPYIYSLGSPIMLVDPNGRSVGNGPLVVNNYSSSSVVTTGGDPSND